MPFWLDTAKRIEALAQAGLAYSSNQYDIERYEELKQISYNMMQEYSGTPVDIIKDLFSGETGYPTPKVDIRGVVIRDNKILLIQEKSDHRWALPGGWADIGFSPRQVVVKEVFEEAGLKVNAERLLAVYDKNLHDHPPAAFHVYKFFILCSGAEGYPVAGSETLDAGFFPVSGLPPLSVERNTEMQIRTMFDLSRQPGAEVLFD
jgi:ADP-ribose pyrophosphatase YjhB (NUDIX family)